MTELNDIPDELITAIFEILEQPRSLFAMMLTNWRFCHIAKEILYQHVCLGYSKTSFLKHGVSGHHLVRSLTITGVNQYASSEVEEEAQVEPTAQTLAGMARLTTFSLKLISRISFDSDEEYIPLDSTIARVIKALPSTITFLEIDTYGT
jgi:hypothetical protein